MPKKKQFDPSDLEQMAEKILAEAQKRGLQSNYLFSTTFQRYRVQLRILQELETEINAAGSLLVEKEYVRGSKNSYAHPAIREYNSTCQSANNTVQALLKIIATFGGAEAPAESRLQKLMREA